MGNNVPRDGRKSDSPDQLRKQAAHVRWLASEFPDDKIAKRLNDYAKELEARAAELERGGA